MQPYHNFKHAFSVVHVVYNIIKRSQLQQKLSSLEILTAMVAAFAHDADHPGRDNQYEILSESELAICYNDISVLENHHAAVTFLLLKGKYYRGN